MVKKKLSKKKRRLLDVLMVLLLLLGVGILLYPFVQDTLNDILDQQLISYYQEKANQENRQASEKAKHELEKKNQQLVEKGNNPGVAHFDPSVNREKSAKKKNINYYKKHTIAVLHIPKISVKLPIFDETNDFTLQKGATLLEGTSYPIGGKSTHAVISGHRGLPEATLFTNLPKLKINDQFYLDINSERHAYQVEKIQVIEPTDTQKMIIQPNRDLITLMTCTPYMVNTQRLLVTGHRIPYDAKKEDKIIQENNWWKKQWRLIVVAGVVLFIVVAGFVYHHILAARLARRKIDVSFYVIDQQERPLEGQVFSLIAASRNGQMRHEGKPVQLVADAVGCVEIKQLSGGKYWLIPQNIGEQATFKIFLKSPLDDQFIFSFSKKFIGDFIKKNSHIYIIL